MTPPPIGDAGGLAPPGAAERIAFLVCGYDFAGGMERQARRLAEGIAARGVGVTYVTTSPNRDGRPLREHIDGVDVVRVPVLASVDWPTSLGVLEVTALQVLASERSQLLGLYSVHHETGAIAVRVGQALGVPVAVKLACSGRFGDAESVLVHEDRERLEAGLRGVDALVAITAEIEREARELLGIEPARIVRLNNGVDLNRFRYRERAPVPGRVLFLGRMSEQKRVDVLLEAAVHLVRDWPELPLDLVLAGDGPLLAGLEVQAERLGLGKRARFPGRVEDVRPLLETAAAIVLPSQVEGTPNSLLEAMAVGVPIVATQVEGTAELIEDGVEGLLVPPGDPAALATALERVLFEAELAAGLRERARARVERDHDLEQIVESHLELFRQLERARAGERSSDSSAGVLRATTSAGIRAGRDAVRSTARLVADQVRRRLTNSGRASRSQLAQEQGQQPAPPPAEAPRQRRRVRGVALLVRDIDALGGMERQAARLAEGLVEAGFEVTIVTCTSPGLLKLPEHWREERHGAALYRVPLLFYESAAGSLLYRLRDRFQVIYAVQLMMGAIGARLGRLLDVPVAVKLACGGPWGDMAAWQALPPADRELVEADLRQTQLVCVSEEIAEEARAAGFVAEQLARIPNGIDRRAAERAAPVRPLGEVPAIVFAGRLDRQKGVDVLIHAFHLVHQRMPEARLLLAGTGPERDELEQLVERLQLAGAVRFLGRRNDVWGLLRGATVCAVPSRSEGISNTLLEALAIGAPVVATGIRPNAEVLEGGAGILVPPDDVDAFAQALVSLLQDPAHRARLSRAGRRRIQERYALERVVEQYGALFEQLAGQPGSGPGTLDFTRRFLGARGGDLWRVARRLVPAAD